MADAEINHIPGLLADAWREPAAERATALYRPVHGPLARLLAQTHRFAIDYLEQCPALLVFASWGYAAKRPEHKMLIARRFGGAVSRGPKLRALVEHFQGAYPLRKITGKALTGSNFELIMDLRTIPPSELAQMIPDGAKEQERWLRALRFVRSRTKRMLMSKSEPVWLWGARVMTDALAAGIATPENQFHSIVDFISRSNRPFNPSWTFRSALEAAEDWHRELRARNDAEQFSKRHGLKIGDQIDYSPLPNDAVEFAGLEFIPLRSGEALFLEGSAMRHCVASYAADVVLGRSRIFSIRKDGYRVATMELVRKVVARNSATNTPEALREGRLTVDLITTAAYRLQQIKGPCNAAVPASIRARVEAFIAMVNGEEL